MKIIIDSDPSSEPFPLEYKNIKGFIFMALTEVDGKYKLGTYYGYGDLSPEEYDDAQVQAMVEQFGLYWQDAKMWMKEVG
jgi:hypothetical protein